VIILFAVIGIGLALAAELALGRFAPGTTAYLAISTLPMVAYALRTSQRSSMLVGASSGLLQDYWMEPRLFGLHGLVNTLLGWAVGGVGARFDLNNVWGRFAAGASVHVVGEGLELAFRKLFGEAVVPMGGATIGLRALSGGVVTAIVLAAVGKLGTGRRAAPPKLRKA
jgi:rod shape-determining protein MreD